MPKLLNPNLFNVGNMIAIGAIVFFWGCAVYAVARNAGTGETATAADAA